MEDESVTKYIGRPQEWGKDREGYVAKIECEETELGYEVGLTLHLRDATSADEALEQAMQFRDFVGMWCKNPYELDFHWHLHHPWGC